MRDIEIEGAGLEEAFLQLTNGGDAANDAGLARRRGGRVSAVTYSRYELLRTFRNRRFFIFALGFPLVLYFLIAGPNRNEHDFGGTGISAPLYFMVGLAAFGTMVAVLSSGARIAADRLGRLEPATANHPANDSSPTSWTKVITSYLTAAVTIVLLYAAGTSLGVRLSVAHSARFNPGSS